MSEEHPVLRMWNYVAQERAVIWRAKGLFTIAALLIAITMAWCTWWFVSYLDSGAIAGLKATISDLQATIQYQSVRLKGFSVGPLPANTERKSWLQNVGTREFTGRGQANVDVFLKNVGSIPSIGMRDVSYATIINGSPPDKMIRSVFHVFKKSLSKVKIGKRDSEVQPKETVFFTAAIKKIPAARFMKLVTNGTNVFFFASMIEYKDEATPSGERRATEICLYWWKGEAVHDCDEHNGVYTIKNAG